MKKVLLISAFLPFSSAFSASIGDFQKLIKQNKIEVRILSTGAYQEDCLQFFISNKSPDSIEVNLLPGWQFNSTNENEQDLILTNATHRKLAPHTKLLLIAKAYCFQASNRAPSKGGRYEPAVTQDTSLRRVAEFIARRNFKPQINQAAIWTISNHHSIAAIPDTSEALQSLRYLLSRLSGQTIPWYHISYVHGLSASGNILKHPRNFSATVDFTLEQDTYITMTLLNDKLDTCGIILCHWQRGVGTVHYPVDVPLRNLEAGNYTLLVSSKDKTLYRNTFEI